VATHGTSPATRSKLPCDAIKDFTPVGMIGAAPNVLVVNATVPAQTIAELGSYLRRNPGRLSYGSAGQGSLTHLTMELYKQAIGAFMVHLPYRGIAPAVTGSTRHPLLKDVPTMVEAGFQGFDAQQWYGVVAPAGLPAAVLKTLNDTLNGVLAGPDLRDKLSAEAVEPQPMSPEAVAAYIRQDIARWTALARERNIVLDA
jgi:tripartite-type tricarboxylate transporter receptor subunit TctC